MRTDALNLLNDQLNALTHRVVTNSHGLYNTTNNNPILPPWVPAGL